MSPEYPEHLREEPRRSTWWVGRSPQPRPWWRDGVFPLAFQLWVTLTFFLTSNDRYWGLALSWLVNGAYLGWLLLCHRRGRDPNDNRVGRWGDAHPVATSLASGLVLLVIAGPTLFA